MSKIIKGFIIDVVNKKAQPCEVKRNLESYYDLLNCDCIDIARRKIGGKYFDIILDDEGLFKDKPIPAAICEDASLLVGNILVVGIPEAHDIYCKETSLSDKDVKEIAQHIKFAIIDGDVTPILTGLKY